jgi:hypothetical protein
MSKFDPRRRYSAVRLLAGSRWHTKGEIFRSDCDSVSSDKIRFCCIHTEYSKYRRVQVKLDLLRHEQIRLVVEVGGVAPWVVESFLHGGYHFKYAN